MDMHIYRIFNALGDSIITSTYFKKFGIKRVFYNRAEFKTLNEVMELYGVEKPKFIQQSNRIPKTLVPYIVEMKEHKVPLLKLNVDLNPQEYVTTQLSTKTGPDRAMNLKEAEIHNKKSYEIKNVSQSKTIPDLISLLKESSRHISIDSGTAWLSSSMGVETFVISKNSYYFADAYHYMSYLQIQKKTKIYQQHGLGLKIPTLEEYVKASKDNNISVGSYDDYYKKVLRI